MNNIIKAFKLWRGGKLIPKCLPGNTISFEDYKNQKRLETTLKAIQKATTRKLPYMFKNPNWANCIATATDNFGGPIAIRNSEFTQDPAKYGFLELLFGDNIDTLPDGVLILDYNKPNDSSTPGHMVMLTGRTETGAPIYSYSSGKSRAEDMHNNVVNYGFYRWDNKIKPRAYLYVGTKLDLDKWFKEWKDLYIKFNPGEFEEDLKSK